MIFKSGASIISWAFVQLAIFTGFYVLAPHHIAFAVIAAIPVSIWVALQVADNDYFSKISRLAGGLIAGVLTAIFILILWIS